MNAPITLPEISPSEAQHPAVVKLLEVLHQQVLIIQQQSETIHGLQDELQRLKDEIAHLKQHKSKPKIRPSQWLCCMNRVSVGFFLLLWSIRR